MGPARRFEHDSLALQERRRDTREVLPGSLAVNPERHLSRLVAFVVECARGAVHAACPT